MFGKSLIVAATAIALAQVLTPTSAEASNIQFLQGTMGNQALEDQKGSREINKESLKKDKEDRKAIEAKKKKKKKRSASRSQAEKRLEQQRKALTRNWGG